MIYRIWSTAFYKGCSESLRGVDTSMIHHMRCTPFYMGCSESLEGVDPSMLQHMGCTLIYKACSESLKAVDMVLGAGVIRYFLDTMLHITAARGALVSRVVVNPYAL